MIIKNIPAPDPATDVAVLAARKNGNRRQSTQNCVRLQVRNQRELYMAKAFECRGIVKEELSGEGWGCY